MKNFWNQDYPLRVPYAGSLRQIAQYNRESVPEGKVQQGSKEPQVLRPEGIQGRKNGDQISRRKIRQQPDYMIAAKKRQGAFARNLDFDQTRVTALSVPEVRIAVDCAGSA